MAVMMKCGHSANAENLDSKPVCVICVGTTPNAEIVDDKVIDLTNRVARCSCGHETPSKDTLPFFEYREEQAKDRYYCGHYGWN